MESGRPPLAEIKQRALVAGAAFVLLLVFFMVALVSIALS